MDKIAIDQKFAAFSEHWRPKVVASLNGQEVKVVKVQGVFPWHHHDDIEEMFARLARPISRRIPRPLVEMGPGEAVLVPRGVEHRTAADEEADSDLRTGRRPQHGQCRFSRRPRTAAKPNERAKPRPPGLRASRRFR